MGRIERAEAKAKAKKEALIKKTISDEKEISEALTKIENEMRYKDDGKYNYEFMKWIGYYDQLVSSKRSHVEADKKFEM